MFYSVPTQRLLAMTVLGAGLLLGAIAWAADEKQEPIDWSRAQQLHQKFRAGETLTPEQRTYLDRALEARKKGAKSGPAQNVPPPREHTGLIPLDQMTAKDSYKGEDGGLYGGGQNVPPPAHQKAVEKELAKIAPLGPDGRPAADGKIVLLSIGMSNTTQEFSKFKELADADPAKSPQVAIVDGAQGGQDAALWNDPSQRAWKTCEERIQKAGVTPQQIQVVWMKHARIAPAKYGDYPKHAEELAGHTIASLSIAEQKFPNLRIVYLSSRIYAGYATTGLNPEPYSYEGAFVVRKLIQDQIKGEAKLNYDPAKGAVKSPLLLWGPYLWADGTTPRKSDGLIWVREDLRAEDGTHPSVASGREKVARLLLGFLKTDRNAKCWFCSSAAVSAGK